MSVTFNSAKYTKQVGAAGSSASINYPLSKFVAGKLRYAVIEYALAGTEVATDIINLVRLKAGAVVIASLSILKCEDPGTALTLDIGFASNDDALLDGAALTTAHDLAFTKHASVTATANDFTPTALAAGDEVIFATVKTATTLTVGAKLLFLIAYVDE